MKEVNVCESIEIKSEKKFYSQPQLEEMGKLNTITKNIKGGSKFDSENPDANDLFE